MFELPDASCYHRSHRDVAQLGSALDWGSSGRRFKSSHPDFSHSRWLGHPTFKGSVLSDLKILVVDDDANVRETIRDVLLLEDIPVEISEPCIALVDRILQGEIDLIITDLNMPEVDGLDIVKAAMRANDIAGKTVPVYVVTGLGGESKLQEAIALGASGYFPKPFDLDQFLGEIQKCIRQIQSE